MFKLPPSPSVFSPGFLGSFTNDQLLKLSPAYLYQHQVEALKRIKEFFTKSYKPALVVLPTGTGKSGIAVLTPYVCQLKSVLVITPSREISRQIFADFCGSEKTAPFLIRRGFFPSDQPAHEQRTWRPEGIVAETTSDIPKSKNAYLLITNAHKFGTCSSIDIEDLDPKLYDLVIVDEAHHYPANTWREIVKHFYGQSKLLFLTATPYHKGKFILGDEGTILYQKSREEAVNDGIIRPLGDLIEVGDVKDKEPAVFSAVYSRVLKELDVHDKLDPSVRHQAMIIVRLQHEAKTFMEDIPKMPKDECVAYIGGTHIKYLEEFKENKTHLRVLVIIGRLLEGFDQKSVSVLAICRNISPQSKVLFTQFIGRGVRKLSADDPVSTAVISHVRYGQKNNLVSFDYLAEVSPEEEPRDDDPACSPAGLRLKMTIGDGNCFFRAVAQFPTVIESYNHQILRKMATKQMRSIPDLYVPFFTDITTYNDHVEALGRNETWAGDHDIRALSDSLQRPIMVFNYDGTLYNYWGSEFEDKDCIFIAYDGRMHYSALDLDGASPVDIVGAYGNDITES